MKKYIPYIIIAVLIFLLWQKSCTGESKPQTVIVPEQKGSFTERLNPEPIPASEKEYVYKYITKTDTVKITVESPVNEDLMAFYLASKNKDSLYADAIGEREYNIVEEDSLLMTENHIKTQGHLMSFQQSYTIKPREVKVKPKETVLRLLGGFEVGNTTQLDNFTAKANLGLQNRKGNILSVGYDTEERIWIGYDFSIFNIKK